jgi:prephenate dehydrogenase
LEPEKWVSVFTRLLTEQGHTIKLYDVKPRKAKALAERYRLEHLISLPEAVSGVDLVLICATTETVPGLVTDVEPPKGSDTIISEIASFKMKTIPALKKSGGIRPLSVHPMFGPDIDTFKGETFAVVSVNDSLKEMEMARMLFPGAKLIPLTPEVHDRCMASLLSLPYFMNLAFACALTEGDLQLMKELAGPTFKIQMSVTQSILGESPELIHSLVNDNVFSLALFQKFIKETQHLATLFESGPKSVAPLLGDLRDFFGGDVKLKSARALRNLMLGSLKKN